VASEHRFYHLTRTSLDQALPRLLERVLGAGRRAVVLAPGEARVAQLDALLWTYDPDSFLPHGTQALGHPADQPVWLTHVDENPNGATDLFLVDGARSRTIDRFGHCFDLFDGGDAAAVTDARERWREGRSVGRLLRYFQQTDRGWTEKAGS
jgi:DNA polymerase-3 subunit chi